MIGQEEITPSPKVHWRTLQRQLKNLESRHYKAYKSIAGNYEFDDFALFIDAVQGDPFAAPSRIRLVVSQSVAQFPQAWLATTNAQSAIADYLTRAIAHIAKHLGKKRGSGSSGQISIAQPSQAMLRRTALWIDPRGIEARLSIGLPAVGRRIAGQAASELICDDLPQIVSRGLKYSALDALALRRHIETFETAETLRAQLEPRKLVAFIAEGACLPRRSGVDNRPLPLQADLQAELGAHLFQVPPADSLSLRGASGKPIRGLGIPTGVTLIVGGGYHGKSTLLRAIEQGIYNHIPDDGRQEVVSLREVVRIRAEDGRSVSGVDLSPIINHLPKGRSSRHFSTTNASGSTSQAASLIEAIEAGAKVILIDEDTAATNFMTRDHKMQALIAKDKEPITPFIDKVRQLYNDYGISTILVIGGSGDYFSVADTVIAMEDYQPRIVTERAKAIALADQDRRKPEGSDRFGPLTPRIPLKISFEHRPGRPPQLKAFPDQLKLGSDSIDLRALEQLVEPHQIRAIGQAILYAQRFYIDGQQPLSAILDQLMADISQGGLDGLAPEALSLGTHTANPHLRGDLASFRRFDLAVAINRLRTLQICSIS